MTTHGDMIMEYGGVPVGAGRLAKIFQAKNIFFVDYDTGQDGASGKKPTEAKQIPSAAVTDAVKEAIIYIRPRTTIACDVIYYPDNVVIPITKPHIQLIGAGAGTIPGYRGGAQIRPLVVTSNVIEIQSAGVCIENLHINNDGTTTAIAAIRCGRSPTNPGAVAPQIRHCRIVANTTSAYGIALESAQYCIVEDNIFYECNIGVYMTATHASPVAYTIRRNIFSGLVANRNCDIGINMTDINSHGHIIDSNIFADGLPNKAGEFTTRFIFDTLAASSAATGIISNNMFASPSGGTAGAAGNKIMVAAGWFLSGNQDEDGPLPRT